MKATRQGSRIWKLNVCITPQQAKHIPKSLVHREFLGIQSAVIVEQSSIYLLGIRSLIIMDELEQPVSEIVNSYSFYASRPILNGLVTMMA